MLRFRDKAYVERLENGEGDVLAKGREYEELAKSGRLANLRPSSGVSPHVKENDLPRLYTQGLLRRDSEARIYYENIRFSSPLGICPLCNHRDVKTLDHFLPKSIFEAFSVLPINLIPCCRDCNTEKLTISFKDRDSELLHPYFDNIDVIPWLGCEITVERSGVVADYYIISNNVSKELSNRLLAHCNSFDLFTLYGVQAARELNGLRDALVRTFGDGGSTTVAEFCEKIGKSRAAVSLNHWQAVLWLEASRSERFCSVEWAI